MPGNAVVPRQTFVDERVVGVQQIDDAAVLADGARDEQLGFALEGLQQAQVVVRIEIRIDDYLVDAPQIQPLRREIVDQRVGRARVGQHPAHFLLEHRTDRKLSALRQPEQPIVRDAAPQEERQPRSQVEIAEDSCRCGSR